MVKHGRRYVELDKDKVLGWPELVVIESYHVKEGLGSVISHEVSHQGYEKDFALFLLSIMYKEEKPLPFAVLSKLVKGVIGDAVWYDVPIYIPVKHLEERLAVHGFSLQSLDRRYVEFEVRLKEGWTNPLRDVASVGLNVWYEDRFGNPIPEDFGSKAMP